MDFGGLLAGAMAGGGKAIQENAQNQLEQQRQTALLDIERKYNRENLDYEYNRKGDIAQQEAAADAAQAAIDRQAQLERIAAEGNQERLTEQTKAELDGSDINSMVSDAYDRAESRAKTGYQGDVEITSSALGFGREDQSDPVFRSYLASELRAEAEATNNDAVRQQLSRQADALEPSSESSNQSGASGSGLIDPNSVFSTQ